MALSLRIQSALLTRSRVSQCGNMGMAMILLKKIFTFTLMIFTIGVLLPITAAALPPVADISGFGNNKRHPEWGTAGQPFLRGSPSAYTDGISSPSGKNRPSARKISNLISAQGDIETHDIRKIAAYVYTWGQFIDHDIDITLTASPNEAFDISVPKGDRYFDPNHSGTEVIRLNRSRHAPDTGTDITNPRQQLNHVTAFVDASMIYGSDKLRARALRTLKNGLLKTSPADLLPLNNGSYFSAALANDNDAHVVNDDQLFVAGDIRANENIELVALHTLFMREHNRLATIIKKKQPRLSDEQIYQYARAIVRSEIQVITYNEWLPTLLGGNRLPPYTGYKPSVNPGINTEFSTAALRIGHTLLAGDIDFIDNDGNEMREPINLRQAFFNPATINELGIDPILKYLATSNASKVDTLLVDDIRNFLFGQPGAGGLDLASLNIQRGRDHGLTDYNSARAAFNLSPVLKFSDITSSEKLQSKLKSLYGNVNNIDMWVGGLSEKYEPNSSVGPFFTKIIVDQFTRLRDGDRFWYENVFSGNELRSLKQNTLSDVIRRNTKIDNLQDNVFVFDVTINGSVLKNDEFKSPMENMSVRLYDSEDELVETVKSDANGTFTFHSIHESGAYKITLPRKYKTTTPNPFPVQVSKGGAIDGIKIIVAN